jgi:hypothetical protein
VLLLGVMRRRLPARRREPPRGRLERALRLLRESARRPGPDRRRAADYLAQTLEAGAALPLARDATRVAWSPPEPAPIDVESLAARAEAELTERT